MWRAPQLAETSSAEAPPLALVVLGGVGEPHARDARLRESLASRLTRSPDAPLLLLGDVFQGAGLLGFCPSETKQRRSTPDCVHPGSSEAQFDAILGPYARSFPTHPVLAVAGAADHAGDPAATANACARIHAAGAGWRYFAQGCELDAEHPVARLDAGALALVALDSQAMLVDEEFRARSLAALHAELAALRQARPDAWVILALYHPLETYGKRNGSEWPDALRKDLPLAWPLQWLIGYEAQHTFEWRVRGLRRDLYAALEASPVDAVVSAQDESLQLVELDHPGARWQIVSGSAARKTRVKRLGLDWLWTNRLARALGLRDFAPSVGHELLFAAGRADDEAARSGYGYAVLAASPQTLRVEFWDLAVNAPLGVAELVRPGDAPQRGQREDQ